MSFISAQQTVYASTPTGVCKNMYKPSYGPESFFLQKPTVSYSRNFPQYIEPEFSTMLTQPHNSFLSSGW